MLWVVKQDKEARKCFFVVGSNRGHAKYAIIQKLHDKVREGPLSKKKQK